MTDLSIERQKELIEMMMCKLNTSVEHKTYIPLHFIDKRKAINTLMNEGIPHIKFNLGEIIHIHALAKNGTFIRTDDKNFYLCDESGELYVLLELL